MTKRDKKNKDQQQDKKIAKINKKIKKVARQKKIPPGFYGMSISDRDLISSFHQGANTIFYPSLGVHRGIARAFTETGLARISDSFNIPAGTSTNDILTFVVKPAACNASGWLKYEWGTTVGTDASATASASVISSTQASDFRVLGMEMVITPQGAFTSQAGSGIIGYVADTTGFSLGQTTIAQLAIKKDIKGVDPVTLHWIPSDFEQGFTLYSGAQTANSAFVGFYTVPSASAASTSFQVDYSLVIEYLPSTTYRPWVTRSKPTLDARVFRYINDYAEKHADPLMIGLSSDYMCYLKEATRHEGGMMSIESITAATDKPVIKAIEDNKSWFQHVVEGDFSGAGEHARAIESGVGVGVLNTALGMVNSVLPDAFDIPYLGMSPA